MKPSKNIYCQTFKSYEKDILCSDILFFGLTNSD